MAVNELDPRVNEVIRRKLPDWVLPPRIIKHLDSPCPSCKSHSLYCASVDQGEMTYDIVFAHFCLECEYLDTQGLKGEKDDLPPDQTSPNYCTLCESNAATASAKS